MGQPCECVRAGALQGLAINILLVCFYVFILRITFAAGREGHMIKVMSMVNVKRLTPLPAIVLQVRCFYKELVKYMYTFSRKQF